MYRVNGQRGALSIDNVYAIHSSPKSLAIATTMIRRQVERKLGRSGSCIASLVAVIQLSGRSIHWSKWHNHSPATVFRAAAVHNCIKAKYGRP